MPIIAADIKSDTRKLHTTEAFTAGVDGEIQERRFGPGTGMSLKTFVEKRREYLLNHADVKNVARR